MSLVFEYKCFVCGMKKPIKYFVKPRTKKRAICKMCAGEVNKIIPTKKGVLLVKK
jgi:hypothetical protein